MSLQGKFVFRLLLSFGRFLPLKDSIRKNDDASFEKGIPPEPGSINALGAGIEEKPVRELESPTHELELTLAVRVNGNDRLHGTVRNVVGFAAVAATHSLSVSLQRQKLTRNKLSQSNELAHSAQVAVQMLVDSARTR